MHGLKDEIARLFTPPGQPGESTEFILREAAAAHLELLRAARRTVAPRECPALPLLVSLLPRDPRARLRFLCDPVLTEGLHELAVRSPVVRAWHDCTADSGQDRLQPAAGGVPDDRRCCRLGNAALPMLLRHAPDWSGTLELTTDRYGLLRFATSDWCLSVTTATDPPCIAVDQRVCVRLDGQNATWSLAAKSPQPFLRMPRRTLIQLVADNHPSPQGGPLQSLDPSLCSRWWLGTSLCSFGTRFLPVHCSAESQAACCGGIVKRLHDQLHRASAGIHLEFCSYVKSILGFDQAGADSGTVQSFSEPTQPRLMGLNVPFNAPDEPRICPFCLTCLGHEMAHTKMYLTESVGWRRGWRFLRNSGSATATIPRYGRAIKLRTLFQIPYTHLYEWSLLLDACDAGLSRFNPSSASLVRFGEELRDELTEAFDSIERLAEPTPHGQCALERCHRLFDALDSRWRRLRRGIGVRPRMDRRGR